jgi:flagellar biosynthesis/type III secretory pathway M-ring protein FliF/YscJ
MTPLLLELMVRFDSSALTIVCLALVGALVALLLYLPIAKRRAYNRGASAAEPKLTRERDVAENQRDSARLLARERQVRIVELLAVNATMRGQAADLQRRAAAMIEAHEAPTEAQAHVLRMEGRR